MAQTLRRDEPVAGFSLSSHNIDRLSKIALREAGIVLGEQKRDFIMARTSRLLKAQHMRSFSDYCSLLEADESGADIKRFVESITTHTTNFFRENGHYDWLTKEGFGGFWDAGIGRDRDLNIWSAACSTGQELYSAMIAASEWRSPNESALRVKGFGTDLSRKVVKTAQDAIYLREEISGIPESMRQRHLLSSKSGDGRVRIAPDTRRITEWRVANLTAVQTLNAIKADVIFLRNVLIYFDADTQNAVIKNVLSRLQPGGVLLTGHSETTHVRSHGLTVIAPTIYQKDTA